MRKILQKLYHGKIHPHEKAFTQNTQCKKALATVSKIENALTGLILGKPKEERLLDELIEAQSTAVKITAEENFLEGFRLGMRIGTEVMVRDGGDYLHAD